MPRWIKHDLRYCDGSHGAYNKEKQPGTSSGSNNDDDDDEDSESKVWKKQLYHVLMIINIEYHNGFRKGSNLFSLLPL